MSLSPYTLIRCVYVSVSIYFQERFQINAFSMKTLGVLVWTERPIRIEMYALSNENVLVWTRSPAMRLNCLFPESFKSRVPNSRVFFSVKASIYFAGDQLCAVRQCWGVCNGKVSWSPKRKLTVMINASFSEYIKPINHPLHHYTKWATVVVSAYLAQRHWYCKRAVTMKSVQKINYKEQTIRETCPGS